MEVASLTRAVTMRAGSGLGDSLYLQSAARHFVEKGRHVEVHSNWPDVFRPLAGKVTVEPFSRVEVDRIVHYTQGKNNRRTTQWQDCLARAGIKGEPELRLDWKPGNTGLVEGVRRGKRPVIAVLLPRAPMNRDDGFGDELLPSGAVMQRALDEIGGRAKTVLIGSGAARYPLHGIDLNLSNNTSVSDLLDVASAADGFLGYVSFFVPLAESLGKPGLFIWSRRGLESNTDYIRTITPQKIIHRPDLLRAVIDNEPDNLAKAVDAFLEQAGASRGL
jgi:hypothetical protein